jgi:hypothetical protein
MAVTVASVLDPFGPVLPAWFPGEGDGTADTALHARLQFYVDQASVKPELANADDEDAAVLRWVEYRVYSALQARSASMAGVRSVTLADQGSFTMAGGNEQVASWGRSAQYALNAWRLLTAEPEIARTADGRFARYAWTPPALPEPVEGT